jgi:hypothetical protein
MSLPLKAIDRLFERLAATYGNEWTARWMGQDENKVKTIWSYELGAYEHHLEDIAWALENLPSRAPNAVEFRQLCRCAPRLEQLPALPEPKADPGRVNEELAKLRDLLKAAPAIRHDPKDWARRIIARHEAGDKINAAPLQMARQALGVAA